MYLGDGSKAEFNPWNRGEKTKATSGGAHAPITPSLLQQNEKQRQGDHPAAHGLGSFEQQKQDTPYLNNVQRVQEVGSSGKGTCH